LDGFLKAPQLELLNPIVLGIPFDFVSVALPPPRIIGTLVR
jgi:hypothetical protein